MPKPLKKPLPEEVCLPPRKINPENSTCRAPGIMARFTFAVGNSCGAGPVEHSAICPPAGGDWRFFFLANRTHQPSASLATGRAQSMMRTNNANRPVSGLVLTVPAMVGYPSGQRGQTVNLLAHAFSGSNPEPTTTFFHGENTGFPDWLVFNPCAFLLFPSFAFLSSWFHLKQSKSNQQASDRRKAPIPSRGMGTPVRLKDL